MARSNGYRFTRLTLAKSSYFNLAMNKFNKKRAQQMASLSTRAAKLIKLTLDFETSDFNVYFDILVESR